jgi:fumarate reductase flavoprotein subunit
MKKGSLLLMIGLVFMLSLNVSQAETLKADVVVVGTGAAGMGAAVTAADGGAKVIVFEKMPIAGGASNMAMGGISPDPKQVDAAFKEIMEYTHWRTDARLVRAFLDKASSNREWCEQHGVELLPIPPAMAAHGFGHFLPKPEGRGHGGGAMVKTLVARAREKGVDIRLSTPVQKLIQEKGKIVGVIAKDKDGKAIRVDARAVVLATGGFGNNKEMLKEYTGFSGDELFLMKDIKATGDGIRMAWDVGAAKEGMGPHMIYNVPGPGIVGEMPWLSLNQVRIIQWQPHLSVNQEGLRFFDEAVAANSTFTGNAIARQKGRCAYLIFDESIRKKMEQAFDNTYSVFPGMEKLIDFDGQLKGLKEAGNTNVFVADSLEELAKKMGVNPAVLKATVDQYNGFCEKGHDDLFAKDPKLLRPVKEPKFYAFRCVPSAYGTFGGIKVNEKMEALNKEQGPIPGLYAAGYDGHTIFGDPPDYDWKTSGSGLGYALATGRIAGDSALKYLGK